MKHAESKQEKALRQFEKLQPELLKLFLGAPDYGSTRVAIHFYEGAVTRIVHGFKQSIIPIESEAMNRRGYE